MFNWMKKIDDQDLKETQALRSYQDLSKNQEQARTDEVRMTNLKQLGQRFQCQISNHGMPSQRPASKGTGVFHDVSAGADGDFTRTEEDFVEDWSKPGDLQRCKKCQKWACDEHIYKGICQTCAEKM